MMNDLKILKEKYGENFAKLCRSLFPTLLETEGLLSNLILSKFAPNHFLYQDIIKCNDVETFKNYIYSLSNEKVELIKTNKTVKELFNEKDYDFYECKTEEDIQSFKKYYSVGEELCTFIGDRLKYCFVFFAVKKNVDSIKREYFKKPERQDDYGKSVISIQFTRGKVNTLSIKNRYNHAVQNPDATFSNNLDNINPGLTDAFTREYNLNINYNTHNLNISPYTLASDGKLYRYNYEINNVYYCPNNIIIDNGEVKQLDRSRYILVDYYIIDLQEEKIRLYDEFGVFDHFVDIFKDMNEMDKKDKKISVDLNKKNGNKIITLQYKEKKVFIEIDEFGNIIKFKNDYIKVIPYNFMKYNNHLKVFDCKNVQIINSYFLYMNKDLEVLNCPKLLKIGSYCMQSNKSLLTYNYPNLYRIKDNSFLSENEIIRKKIKRRMQILKLSKTLLGSIKARKLESEIRKDNSNK